MTPGGWVVVGTVAACVLVLLGWGLKSWHQGRVDAAATSNADDQLDADRERAEGKVIELSDKEALAEARAAWGRKPRKP